VKESYHVWYISSLLELSPAPERRLDYGFPPFCFSPFSIPILVYAVEMTTGDYGYEYATAPGSQLDGADSYPDIAAKQEEYDYDMDDSSIPLAEDDLWIVINSFFHEKGLVNQQLSSFNEFMETTIVDVMEEHGTFTLDQTSQGGTRAMDATVSQGNALCQRWSAFEPSLASTLYRPVDRDDSTSNSAMSTSDLPT